MLRAYAAREPAGARRRLVLRFLRSPVALLGQDRVEAVRIARNTLVERPEGGLAARPTGEEETLEAGLVLRAIGYRGVPLPGVPFDAARGTIANERGRVRDEEGPCAGEYVVGWIKRGPTGVIGTNKKDAQETVDLILEDLAGGRLPEPDAGTPDLQDLLDERHPGVVSYEGWQRIDRHEQGLGRPTGRPRVKLTRLGEMVEIAAAD
jgi:ferredoxin--NADP+ reductase